MTTEQIKSGWKLGPAWPNPIVDEHGVKWFLLDCRYSFGDWIESNDAQLWKVEGQYHHGRYWVHEALMTIILLKKV